MVLKCGCQENNWTNRISIGDINQNKSTKIHPIAWRKCEKNIFPVIYFRNSESVIYRLTKIILPPQFSLPILFVKW